MAGATREKTLELAARRDRVARAFFKGTPQYKIAEIEKVAGSQITRDLQALEAAWLESGVRNFDASKAQELAKIDNLERVAWEAWERSTQPAIKQRRKRKVQPPDEQPVGGDALSATSSDERTTERIYRDGDPRFLERISWCIEQRCKILKLVDPDIAAGAIIGQIIVIGEGAGDILPPDPPKADDVGGLPEPLALNGHIENVSS